MAIDSPNGTIHEERSAAKVQGDQKASGIAQAIAAAAAVKTGDSAEVANEALLTERHKATCETLEKIFSGSTIQEIAKVIDGQVKTIVERKAQAQEKVAGDAMQHLKWAFVVFLVWMLGALGFIVLIIRELKDQKDLLLPIFSGVIALITGITGVFFAGRQFPPRSGK